MRGEMLPVISPPTLYTREERKETIDSSFLSSHCRKRWTKRKSGINFVMPLFQN
jgi:hypothetical protein